MANTDLYDMAGGVPVPRSAFQGGQLAPAIRNLAREYSKEGQSAVTGYLGQRGLLKSSFLPTLQNKAYQSGFDRAMRDYTTAQQTQMPWAQTLLQGKLQEGAAPQEAPWWQRALLAGATGALTGGASGWGAKESGGFGGKGAAAGAGIGVLSTLF